MNRDELVTEYERLRDTSAPLQHCAVCGMLGDRNRMHPHHTHGRHGRNILRFVWVHPDCHRTCHDNVGTSRELGYIAYENEEHKKK